jgi:DNA repair protein RecO
MSRETTYQSIILKKQPFGEGDEIITLYTREAGKLRVMAKSTKFSKSKLQHALQSLFLTAITTVGNKGLPKVIGAEVKNAFFHIRENLEAAKISFYAIELALKFTPDEEKNESLFSLLEAFFHFLDSNTDHPETVAMGLAKFKIEFLRSLGLGIQVPPAGAVSNYVGFSNSRGGFFLDAGAVDYVPVQGRTLEQFMELEQLPFLEISSHAHNNEQSAESLGELQKLLSGFIVYQLERDVKTESLLGL